MRLSGRPTIQPMPVSYSYNGELHGYSLAGVVAPASCPLVWEGDGKAKLLGYQTANPDMVCDTGNCTYQAGRQRRLLRQRLHRLHLERISIPTDR